MLRAKMHRFGTESVEKALVQITDFCELLLVAEKDMLTGVLFFRPDEMVRPGPAKSGVLGETAAQLQAYFAGERMSFSLPLNPAGTPFQCRVWDELQRIPYGETRSYGALAAAVGNPKAARAVGLANNRNPIGIIIPCHRVIGANGSLTGYAGGLHLKAALLQHEALHLLQGFSE